jgi:hypothetical protein
VPVKQNIDEKTAKAKQNTFKTIVHNFLRLEELFIKEHFVLIVS